MELIKAFAIGLHEDKDFNGVWPEPATEFTQTSTWGGEFDEEVPMTSWNGTAMTSTEFEFDNGSYLEEYEDGETITKEEYINFLGENPNWYANTVARRPALIAQIAELNTQISTLIDQATALADEAGVGFEIDLGQHGSLDLNSDWDSSRC